jgi:hypothetical protein
VSTEEHTRKTIAYLGDEVRRIVPTLLDSSVEILNGLPKPHANDQKGRQA